jgi:cytochrome P450
MLINVVVLVQPYGKEWSIRRKLLHTALTPRALQNYIPVQQAEACRLCYQLLARPQEWEQLLDWMTASIVFSISYGHRIDSMDSPVIRERLSFMHYSASLNVPGKYLAESFPILSHIPTFLAPWKRSIKDHGALEAAANMRLVDYVKSQIANSSSTGTPIPNSLCKQLLDRRAQDPDSFSLLTDRDFSFIPASLFGAGADTTASSLCSAFLALVTHPQTLRAAHAELDAVIGPTRLPTFADEASLPYLRALCKEVLRWRPVAVLGGTPHATSDRDTYRGWHIPKGTNVLGNTWAINHNEDYYPNSQHFNPLRFLDEKITDPADLEYLPREYVRTTPRERGQKTHPSKLGHSSFGWGRRICPGADLASGNLFIALARILWCFDIRGQKGVEYDTWDYVGESCLAFVISW